MTLQQIMNCDKEILTPADVAEVLGCNAYSITLQAREDAKEGKSSLGFPVIVIGNRTKIPRRSFLRFMLRGMEGLEDG